MMKNEFSTGEFEKDCLAVFEKLLQGYNRAKQTSAWETEINTLVERLTHLPTAPFHKELMELFDYHYFVLSHYVYKRCKKIVPIKPICDVFGIDDRFQRTKIQNDEILSSIGVLSTSVGADGKDREIQSTILYVLGWLFGIGNIQI